MPMLEKRVWFIVVNHIYFHRRSNYKPWCYTEQRHSQQTKPCHSEERLLRQTKLCHSEERLLRQTIPCHSEERLLRRRISEILRTYKNRKSSARSYAMTPLQKGVDKKGKSLI